MICDCSFRVIWKWIKNIFSFFLVNHQICCVFFICCVFEFWNLCFLCVCNFSRNTCIIFVGNCPSHGYFHWKSNAKEFLKRKFALFDAVKDSILRICFDTYETPLSKTSHTPTTLSQQIKFRPNESSYNSRAQRIFGVWAWKKYENLQR